MPRAALLVACLLPALATAANVRERWSFAWDLHPQAAEVGYFVLDIRLPGRTLQTRIDGGTQTEVRDVYVDPALQGDGTAVLRACRPNGECSGDSNAVALDRTAPQPPTDVDASSSSTTSVSLNWTASTDNAAVTEYRIEACAGWNCSSWAQIGTSATTSFTHGGLTPATNPTIYRYRIRAADAANNLSGYSTSIYFNARPTIPAFPGAEGAGATSKGGRGGTVYHVTSLSGGTEAGTLRACAVVATGPRTCVFDVAGNIELTSHINVSSPYLTIAGHTAPGGGITISGKNSPNVSLTVRTHNVTIRGLRFRKGYNAGTLAQDGDSTNVTSVSTTSGPVGPVIFDHVSASWGQDENAEVWGMVTRAPKDITYMRSMIYEPLLSHPVNFLTGAFDNATAEKITNIDIHRSILANSSHRNPMVKNKSFRFVHNLVYNWADWAYAQLGTVQADVIGNKFKTGPLYMTASSKAYEIQLDPVGNATTPNVGIASLYVSGNVGPHNADPLADNWPMTRRIDIETNAMAELGPLDSGTYRRISPLPALPFPITVSSITTEEASVLALAGASRRLDCAGNWVGMRDSADARIVTEYGTNAGIIPVNEDAVGGYPTLAAGTACTDTDGDGMPDTWETAQGLNPASAADGNALHASGYTNLEMYLSGTGGGDSINPTDPANLTATTVTTSRIDLSWSASTDNIGVVGYDIERCVGAACIDWTALHSTAGTGTAYSNTGLTANTTYRYRVRARDAAPNYSGYSPIASATTTITYTVTGTAGSNGSISPTSQTVNSGATATLTVTPASGYTASVGGTCGGSLAGTTYTTAAITSNCTVSATFADTTAPSVAITAPATGSTVAGSIAVSATATDGVGVVGVQFKLDGANLGTEDTAAPHTITWATTGTSDGAHALTATARDAASNSATSPTVTVTVDNTPPTVSDPQPNGTLARGTSAVTVTVTTSETAECRRSSTAGFAWASGTAYTATNSTTHTGTVTATPGRNHRIYTLCRDPAGNQSTQAVATFFVPRKPMHKVW